MALRIVAGTANPVLAEEAGAVLGTKPAPAEIERFPDGEIHVVVGPMRGDDVYVLQPTGPPVNDNLVELMVLLDACRRSGARRITAVVPYLGYARQDRRSRPGEAIGIRIVAEALEAAGADRLVVVDPHARGLEAMCPFPVEILTALPVLAASFSDLVAGPGSAAVVVAPDLGAVKLAERFAALVDLPVAVVRKTRVSGAEVHAREVVGEVEGRRTVIVDDMIATGSTIEKAARLLEARGAAPRPAVAAVHGVLVAPAPARLEALDPDRLVVSDSLEVPALGAALEVCSLARLLGEAIGRLHFEESVDDLGAFT